MTKKPKKVVRIVVVVCPDQWGYHKDSPDGVYVRYVILTDEDGNSVFLDDPSYETVREILFTNVGVAAWAEYFDCPFCAAKKSAS